MKHVISCFPSGVVEAVQNDEFPLHENFKGEVSMLRASDVLWCDELQLWQAMIRPWFRRNDEPFVHTSKSRDDCIQWELGYLNNRKLNRKAKEEV